MHPIIGAVQHYDWGDLHAIPDLLGRPADGRPWAEYWLGTHPVAPSTLPDGRPLRELTGELPFLLKLLAAGQPLSLQTHPTDTQAQAGFDREEAAGIALTDQRRVYRDPHAKPELLCALTPFDALCGFRPVEGSVALLESIGASGLADHLAAAGLAATVADLYRGSFDPAPVVDACRAHDGREAALVVELNHRYPGEPSVVVTLLLNRIVLQPGEAVFLAAGNLHAYLHGTGVEIMASSDNVVRGGLTGKHVDVEELLRVLDPQPLANPVLRPVEADPGWFRYPTPPAPFVLSRRDLRRDSARHRCDGRQVLLCTDGDLGVLHAGDAVVLTDGEAIDLTGTGTVFVASER
jgi:mannose-6-phosphate isomerase